MAEQACPSCGETEALQGRPAGDDIAISCQQCGAEWMRGEPRCKACGRSGATTAPQRMTRHPRGTLLAVVGVREVPLCDSCDREVLVAARERRQPVPEGYVSRFLFGEVVDRQAPDAATPRSRTRPRGARAASRQVDAAPAARQDPMPALTDPTVRQAIEAFLREAGEGADSLAMVLVGTRLGASTRLSRLDTEATAQDLSSWLEQTYRERPDQRRQAGATLQLALGHWHARGWLTRDLAAGLE